MKNIARIVVPLAVIGSIAAWYFSTTRGPNEGGLTASGTVEATDADLGFLLAGRLATISPREGDRVSKGDELARLDVREIEATRAAAVAQLAATEARLNELLRGARFQEIAAAEAAARSGEQRVDDARRDATRAVTLLEGGVISRQALEKANTALEVMLEEAERSRQNLALVREGPRPETVDAQRASVEQARPQIALVDAMLGNAIVTAPFAGIVTVRHREPGEAIGPGAPVVTLLDPEDRWVRIYVREDQIGRVRLGGSASIRSDTYPDRVYQSEVVFIGSEAEFTPRNVQTPEERIKLVYPVKVRITGDPDFELKPGVPADVVVSES